MKVRNKWNDILRKNGVIGSHKSPPSTEIRGVYSEKGFAIYLAKYISKEVTDTALRVNCKVWGCSHALSNINVTLGEDTHNDFNEAMTEFTEKTSKGSKEMKHCTVYYTSLHNTKKLPTILREEIAKVRDDISTRIARKKLPPVDLHNIKSNDAQPEANHTRPVQLEVKW